MLQLLQLAGIVLCYCIVNAATANIPLHNKTFPKSLSLGVASAAFQIEGAWNEDGKGENVWDWWMHTYPEQINDKSNGNVACDSYHKWQEDLDLMISLGITHHRLSISWSRILPDGLANNYTINKAGVKYYRTLFESLIAAKITPHVTLYHWDLPLPLHQMGGWLNPVIADHFAAYARICFELYGDIIKTWYTINEPHSYCAYGYTQGFNAPGYKLEAEGMYKCAYVSVLAHAKAYHIYDKEFRSKQNGTISIVLDSPWYEPAQSTTKDNLAVQRAFDFSLGLYANPIFLGNWPAQVISTVDFRSKAEGYSTSRLPKFTQEQIALIKGTSDFFALNTYFTWYAAHQNNQDEMIDPKNVTFFSDQGVIFSEIPFSRNPSDPWLQIEPKGFRKLLNYVYKTYGKEVVVTENGFSTPESLDSMDDQNRITYIEYFLSNLLDAIDQDGVKIAGYTVWSLLDDLEWNMGFTQKLGLVHVDFKSSNRTRKAKSSYTWLKSTIAKRCLVDKCT